MRYYWYIKPIFNLLNRWKKSVFGDPFQPSILLRWLRYGTKNILGNGLALLWILSHVPTNSEGCNKSHPGSRINTFEFFSPGAYSAVNVTCEPTTRDPAQRNHEDLEALGKFKLHKPTSKFDASSHLIHVCFRLTKKRERLGLVGLVLHLAKNFCVQTNLRSHHLEQ